MDGERRTGSHHRFRGRSELAGHVSRDDAHLRERGVPRRKLLTAARWRQRALALALILASAGLACADRPSADDAGGRPAAGGTLIVAGASNLEAFNSLVTTDAIVQDLLL